MSELEQLLERSAGAAEGGAPGRRAARGPSVPARRRAARGARRRRAAGARAAATTRCCAASRWRRCGGARRARHDRRGAVRAAGARARPARASSCCARSTAHVGDAVHDARASRGAGEPWRGAALETLREIASRRARRAVAVAAIADEHVDAALALAESLRGALADVVVESLRGLAAQRRLAGTAAQRSRASGAPREVLEARRAAAARRRRSTRDVAALAEARARRQAAAGRRRARQRAARRACAARRRVLADDGWMTFEAGAAEINAGMTYVGELEGRMQRPRAHARRRAGAVDRARVRGAAVRGRHAPEPAGRRARPAARGDGRREGPRRRRSSTRRPTSGWCARGPSVRDAFDVVRVEPMDEPRTLALAARPRPAPIRRCCARRSRSAATSSATPRCRARCSRCWRRCAGAGRATTPLTMTDVLATITERSGLPLSLLDERERLDVDALRRVLRARA